MYYKDKAIVLSRRVFKESDLLVTVFSKDYGKLTLQAVSAKKTKSKLSGHIEPVTLSNLDWVAGKNLDKLTGAVTVSSFLNTKSDLKKLDVAGYFVRLAEQLTPDRMSDKQVFELLFSALSFLEKTDKDPGFLKVVFGFKLVQILGFNPAEKSSFLSQIKHVVENKADKIDQQKIDLKALQKVLDEEIEMIVN